MTAGKFSGDLLNPKYRIKVCKNGPYLVSGRIPLSEQIICIDADKECHGWLEGKRYPLRETYALCRCGRSKQMPFCDSTHLKIHFDGTETASHALYLEQARVFDGPGLRLTDAPNLCATARFCHRAGGTWKIARQFDDPKSRQTAIEEACDCPSGRLVVWDKNGKAIEPDFPPSIGLVKDPEAAVGPIWVRGGIPIESADGTVYEIRNRVTLCACGKSSNKPFCDGSHAEE